MDAVITKTPEPVGELKELVEKANSVYFNNFDGKSWFGRCIFLSWYCDKGTCTFCFRSVTKDQITDPKNARRSLASVVAEAMLIKGMGWRIEFLTGGYGILDDSEVLRIAKLVHQVLEEKIWINLGEMGMDMLEDFKPHVQGLYSSIETLEPKLHKEVCPDKPIEPYVSMMKDSEKLGYKNAITIIVGLGEKKEDFPLLDKFITDNNIKRITIYALRPVKDTPFENGPTPEDVAWWISKVRISHPTIEIIAGSAIYRVPEISLFLRAGANAITKLPATKAFNTEDALKIEEEYVKAGREFTGRFTAKNVYSIADWEGMLNRIDVTSEERAVIKETLYRYLDSMDKKAKILFKD